MTDMQLADHVLIARIGAAFGIKGWVKLISFTDPLANILSYHHFLYPGPGAEMQVLELDQSKAHGKGFVCHIKGCDDRDSASFYTGKELYIEKSTLPALDDTEFYWYQLEGLRVLTLAGEELGKVDHLLETGANDVLVVKGDEQSIDQEERLIPYLQGKVIEEVDLEQGLIRVDWDKDY